MARIAYIGGFGNGQVSADGVGEALRKAKNVEDFDAYTFSYAMENPEIVRKALKNVPAHIHSAGWLAARQAHPSEITAVGAPLPSSIPSLLMNTGKKSARMTGHMLTGKEAFGAVNKYNLSSAGELARHPWGNLRHLREIARTNAIQDAAALNGNGIQTWLVYNDKDDYFRLTEQQLSLGRNLGIEINLIPGQHDELPLYPAATLEAIDRIRIN